MSNSEEGEILPKNKEKIKSVQKREYQKISHLWFFVISLLFALFIWLWIWDLFVYLKLFLVSLISFVLFVVCSFLFKFNLRKLLETRIYIVSLLIFFILYVLSFFNINIDSYINTYFSGNNLDDEIVTFVPVDSDLTWDKDNYDAISLDEISTQDHQVDEEIPVIENDKQANFDDVIKYLIDKNSITLNTKQNIKFDYISYSNENYPYYRTAYDLKMIGKNINPLKNLLCETYVVMLWLAEKWNVWSYSDIKKAYRDYAKSSDKLPDCKHGEYIKISELN